MIDNVTLNGAVFVEENNPHLSCLVGKCPLFFISSVHMMFNVSVHCQIGNLAIGEELTMAVDYATPCQQDGNSLKLCLPGCATQQFPTSSESKT